MMNIRNNPNVQRLAKVFRAENELRTTIVPSPQEPHRATVTDSVNLSSEAVLLHRIRQRLEETPDVRAERVQALKEAIARGEYRVSGQAIADAMLRTKRLL